LSALKIKNITNKNVIKLNSKTNASIFETFIKLLADIKQKTVNSINVQILSHRMSDLLLWLLNANNTVEILNPNIAELPNSLNHPKGSKLKCPINIKAL